MRQPMRKTLTTATALTAWTIVVFVIFVAAVAPLLGGRMRPHDKPGYNKIKVEARTNGLRVRARGGYFSGAK
jgi:hypothetical protein